MSNMMRGAGDEALMQQQEANWLVVCDAYTKALLIRESIAKLSRKRDEEGASEKHSFIILT